MRRTRFLLLALLSLFALPAVTAAQGGKIPVGSYEMVADSNFSVGFDVTGLMIDFTEKTMTATQGGNLLVSSLVSMDGDVITISDVDGQAMCPGEGKYKIVAIARGIRLTPVSDTCDQRMAVLASVSLIKRG
jgi:hypothetical protein